MIPESEKNGNLPPGIFEATIEEVEDRFSINFQRKKLFGLLLEVLAIFRNCGCPEVYLDGSYITNKDEPEDYDLCYEPTGINATSEFYEFLKNKDRRKERYGGDIFPRMPEPPYHYDHVVHWQIDGRNDDAAKGILKILLRSETAL
ncbi:MAG: hypothetical protein Q8T09_06290 [Candidatus Melainabacteria bacterium]|nr:hypothetical protein [Candidatus Melainabacteria bacterium]